VITDSELGSRGNLSTVNRQLEVRGISDSSAYLGSMLSLHIVLITLEADVEMLRCCDQRQRSLGVLNSAFCLSLIVLDHCTNRQQLSVGLTYSFAATRGTVVSVSSREVFRSEIVADKIDQS